MEPFGSDRPTTTRARSESAALVGTPAAGAGPLALAATAIVPPHVSLCEAAQALGIKLHTLHCWSATGDPRWFELRAWKTLTGAWRVPVAALQRIAGCAPSGEGLVRPSLRVVQRRKA